MQENRLKFFLNYINQPNNKILSESVINNSKKNMGLFYSLGTLMCDWGYNFLSDSYCEQMWNGYKHFVKDVGKSQMKYELRGEYECKSYQEVFEAVYDNPDYMAKYHWGVYTTTFAWEHHLKLYDFFQKEFLSILDEKNDVGKAIELGSGSGIWSMFLTKSLKGWSSTGVDISKTSVALANSFAQANNFTDKVNFMVGDALIFDDDLLYDAGISCFLLEHLENPIDLLINLNKFLKERCYCFVSVALTAAEIDHINEFRKESEVLCLAENAGFRVVKMQSFSPKNYPDSFTFLPRSMAMILQKKGNDIW